MEPALIVSIICASIAAFGTIAGPIFLALVNRGIRRREEKVAEKAAATARELEVKEEAWRQEIKSMVKPIGEQVSTIKADVCEQGKELGEVKDILSDDKEATVLTLRIHMKGIRDRALAAGGLDTGDKAT